MCRLIAYKGEPRQLAELLTWPEHSLLEQSRNSKEMKGRSNGDGWGVGWYETPKDLLPGHQVHVMPAWNSRNLKSLAEKVKGSCFFGHVRAATKGLPVGEMNCHPFVQGRYMWMHNGKMGGFKQLKKKIVDCLNKDVYNLIGGSTDSEHAFALFLQYHSHTDMAEAMLQTIRKLNAIAKEGGIVKPSSYNFVVTNGKEMIATRYAQDDSVMLTLYYRVEKVRGRLGVVVSSEPLTADLRNWRELPKNHMLIVDKYNRISTPEICF